MGGPAKFLALLHSRLVLPGGCGTAASPLRRATSMKWRWRGAHRADRGCVHGRPTSRLHPPSRDTGRSSLPWVQADVTPPRVPDLPLAPTLPLKRRRAFLAFRSVRPLQPVFPSNRPGAGMKPQRLRGWPARPNLPPPPNAADRFQGVFPSTPTITRSWNLLQPAGPKHPNRQTVPSRRFFFVGTGGCRQPVLTCPYFPGRASANFVSPRVPNCRLRLTVAIVDSRGSPLGGAPRRPDARLMDRSG